jgi:argonaut-like protein (fragment)
MSDNFDNKTKTEGTFDDRITHETLETMTEFTDLTQQTSDGDSFSGLPDTTTEDNGETLVTDNQASGSKNKFILLGGAALLVSLIVGGGAFLFSGNGSKQQHRVEQTQEVAQQEIPSLDVASGEGVMEEKPEPKPDIKPEPEKEIVVASGVASEVNQSQASAQQQSSEPVKQSSEPAKEELPSIDMLKDPVVTKPAQVQPQEPVKQPEQQPQSQSKTQQPQTQETIQQVEQVQVEQSQPKVQQVVPQGALAKLESELVGKTLEEQVAYLKGKVVTLQENAACRAPVVKKKVSATKLKTKKPVVKHVNAKKLPKTNVTGLVQGQFWVGSESYVVGDKYKGATIKSIDAANNVVKTNKGSFVAR